MPGGDGPRRDRARRNTPTERTAVAAMERYHPRAGPHAMVIVVKDIVFELEPKNDDHGPLAGWCGKSFAMAPGSVSAKTTGATMPRARETTAGARQAAARRKSPCEVLPRAAARTP
ncbi:MAG TPA: hypothetical protein VKT21_07145, partial [Thermoplasmata archaeon]|nr:hypothetical protein [Thermoplasmata archaeon]